MRRRAMHGARGGVPGARTVLLTATVVCAIIMGVGFWAARNSATGASQPVRIARSVKTVGKVTTVRSVYAITSGGRSRQWVQLTPSDGLTGTDPIIVVLTGINATANQEITRDHLTGYVQAGKAELVYPEGYEKSWNAGGCCGQAEKANVDDVAFLKALVADVDPGHQHPVDLVGYSNGGRLAYRIACSDPRLVDQIAVVKAMPQPGCVVGLPVTIMQMNATNDKEVPYQPGDKGKESPPATVQVARLETTDGCQDHPAVVTRGTLTLTTWQNCADGTKLAFAAYHGGGHSFPQPLPTTPSGAAVIWAFFTGSALPRTG